MTKSILIIGSGILGKATGHFLEQNLENRVTYFDASSEIKEGLLNQGKTVIDVVHFDFDAIFLCLPTDQGDNGLFDLSIFAAYLDLIVGEEKERSKSRDNQVIVIRSTVAPGDINSLISKTPSLNERLVYMPEFLRERVYLEDAVEPRAIIVASPSQNSIAVTTFLFPQMQTKLVELHDFETAEFIKILHNAYNASKISFWNQACLFMNTQGVDSNFVANIVAHTSEASWNPLYGIDSGRAFGGKCLPKDLGALRKWGQSRGLDTGLFDAVYDINELFK